MRSKELDCTGVVAVLGESKSAADVANFYAGRGIKVHWIIRKIRIWTSVDYIDTAYRVQYSTG